MTKLYSVDLAAVPAVVAALRANPGSSQVELVRATGMPDYRVKRCLTVAKRDGLAGVIRRGSRAARWWPADMMAEAKARIEAEVSVRERVERQAYAAARWQRIQGELRGAPELTDGPIRRKASAWAPLPFVCTAPASVFHLGGML